MPVLNNSGFKSPIWLPNGHIQTIYPALFRKLPALKYLRERIETPDKDFLDVDWTFANTKANKSDKLIILSHGLEGNSTRQYILGMVRHAIRQGFDCLAWNFRSCGGEMNKMPRFYHSGATEDLARIVSLATERGYSEINMIGFSLGGNLTLKYLGELSHDSSIKKAVVFSVPMDLRACSLSINEPQNQVYMHRFLRTLKSKIEEKSKVFPDLIKTGDFRHVRNLYDFDHIYTAPLHGFDGADHYYETCSSMHFVKSIKVPTLIINAVNDPLVPFESLPVKEISSLSQVTLESTLEGGHCGFRPARLTDGVYWSEQRALKFIKEGF